MLKQKKDEKNTKDKLEAERAKLNAINKKAATRKVILKYKGGCGCGSYYYDVERIVPMDSKYQDGDRIYDTQDGDKVLY